MTLSDFRKIYKGVIMGNCGYTKESAQDRVARGDADLVAFGRPYITNPDLPERLKNGWPLNPSEDMSLWYTPGPRITSYNVCYTKLLRSRCHPDEAIQYGKSKHANTLEIIWKIDPWLNKGMNSDFERVNGCYHCHGTILEMTDNNLDSYNFV